MSIQTISPKIKPKENKPGFTGLTNWFNDFFSSYEVKPKDKTRFDLIDRKDKTFIREISTNQIAKLKRRINQV